MQNELKHVVSPAAEEFESFDGCTIRFDYYDAASDCTVVVLPGFWRHRRYASMLKFGGLLCGAGYNCAIVDMRGHGESGGRFGFNRDEWRDIDMLFGVLRGRHSIGRCVVVGMSAGGAIAVSTAARATEQICGLFLISPVASFARVRPRINPLTIHRHLALRQAASPPRFHWRLMAEGSLDAVDDIARVNAPVALVHVRNDWLVNHRHSEMLYAAANPPKELHVLDIPGSWHADRIFGAAEGRIEELLFPFLERTLRTK
jgi:pimeloyl-ACP methyl ester carboxylesterase